jgi:ribA/ribD-fused uncharacterized protein
MFTDRARKVVEEVFDRQDPTRADIELLAMEIDKDRGDFYERDLYCLSNFSSFRLDWKGMTFDTSEHAYHWEKFNTDQPRAVGVQAFILSSCQSAHEAFEVANREKSCRRKDWDDVTSNGRRVKVNVMKTILVAKFGQHPYVQKKLRQAFEKKLDITERSWRDSFWGTGPEENGSDWMGCLWMEIARERFA